MSSQFLVIGVECMLLADRCAEHNLPCVVGHALYMRLIHGGKAKNDRVDANKFATCSRGEPPAFVCLSGNPKCPLISLQRAWVRA
jgi:hypothetical protein